MTRGRQRKKLQQQARALADKEAAAAAMREGQGPVTVASDPKRLLSDMDLIGQAINGDWPVAENIKRIVVVALANTVIEGSKVGATDKEAERFLKAAGVLSRQDMANIARRKADQQPGGMQVNFTNNNNIVQVVESDDWYGSRAATNGHLAESNGASGAHLVIPGAIQGGGVRPPVGQNGHRVNGHIEGPRDAAGPAAGSN